jgi:hypothetical protein
MVAMFSFYFDWPSVSVDFFGYDKSHELITDRASEELPDLSHLSHSVYLV